jgi:hypothetical protein
MPPGTRTPGPTGLPDETNASHRQPGPLGIGDETVLPAADGATPMPLQATPPKEITEPTPVFMDKGLTLKNVVTPLFEKDPQAADVIQGSIANCPLAAVLAAVAHTQPTLLKGMIGEQTVDVVSKDKSDPTWSVKTNKLLTVQFRKGSPVEMSRLLYHNGENDLVYARASRNVSWVSFIEKGYAVLRGGNSYNGLNDTTTLNGPPTANKVMEDVVGAYEYTAPAATADKDLLAILARAKTKATIAASQATLPDESPVVANHGYAVMGVSGNTVLLRNPWGGESADKKLPLKDFKTAFQAVLQEK